MFSINSALTFPPLRAPFPLPVGEERGLSRREARLWGIGEGEKAKCVPVS